MLILMKQSILKVKFPNRCLFENATKVKFSHATTQGLSFEKSFLNGCLFHTKKLYLPSTFHSFSFSGFGLAFMTISLNIFLYLYTKMCKKTVLMYRKYTLRSLCTAIVRVRICLPYR